MVYAYVEVKVDMPSVDMVLGKGGVLVELKLERMLENGPF